MKRTVITIQSWPKGNLLAIYSSIKQLLDSNTLSTSAGTAKQIKELLSEAI